MRLPMLVISRLSAYFSKTNLATNDTNDTNEHELTGNMQKATWGWDMVLIFLCVLCAFARDAFDFVCNSNKNHDFF